MEGLNCIENLNDFYRWFSKPPRWSVKPLRRSVEALDSLQFTRQSDDQKIIREVHIFMF